MWKYFIELLGCPGGKPGSLHYHLFLLNLYICGVNVAPWILQVKEMTVVCLISGSHKNVTTLAG